MKFRWTKTELALTSDAKLVRAVIAERMSDLNPYSPLKQRLQKLYNKYNEIIEEEDKRKLSAMNKLADSFNKE